MQEADLVRLGEELFSNPKTVAVARIGSCRVWTKEAIEQVKAFRSQNNLDLTCEAREIELEPGLEHTFLRVLAAGLPPYDYDGTGTSSFGPYKGPEEQATHLQGSHFDMIHSYQSVK
jgi:hypothetical protein